MRKTGFKISALLLAMLLLLVGTVASAQEIYTTYVVDNDLAILPDEPAPDGFKPFYISHFGRHGSRYHLSGVASEGYKLMKKASEKYGLTDEGLKLSFDVNYLHLLHDGKTGVLSVRGSLEHRGIGRRMANRFPEVFTGGRKVYARASIIGRCRKSMESFTDALIAAHPGLNVKTSYSLIAYRLFSRSPKVSGQEKKLRALQRDSVLSANYHPERLEKTYFAQPVLFDDAINLSRALYAYARISGCLDLDKELISKYFTEEEMNALSNDSQFYYSLKLFPQSLEAARCASGLLKDIVDKADAALKDKNPHAADLRFGHDSGFVPLCSLIGLDGFEPWTATPKMVAEAVPMGANLQLIFYKNSKGEVIVKLLHNEKEILIPSLEPWTGSYYKWNSLREWFLSRIR